jgi:hypothetical protein
MAALSHVELASAGTYWRLKKVLHHGRRRETSRYRSAWYRACCREVMIRKDCARLEVLNSGLSKHSVAGCDAVSWRTVSPATRRRSPQYLCLPEGKNWRKSCFCNEYGPTSAFAHVKCGFNSVTARLISGTWINFNCCLSVHVDNYTIIPTKCTRFLLLKAQDITICTFLSCIFAPTCFNPRGSSSGGSTLVPG